MCDLTAHKHLPRIGQAAQACREIERAPAEAPVDPNGLAGVEPDADGQRQHRIGHRLLHESPLELDRRTNRLARRIEDGQRLIPTELDDRPACRGNRRTRHVRELRGEQRGCLVSALLCKTRIPTDVRDQERLDPTRLRRAHPAIIHRGFSLA